MECDSRHFHPTRPTHQCVRCAKSWCGKCLVHTDSTRTLLCPECRDLATKIETRESFGTEVAAAFKYPLNGAGLFVVIGGAIFSAGLHFIASLSMLGGFVMWICMGYLLAYYARVVESSASGERELPDWPEMHWEDLGVPIFRAVVVLGISAGPALWALFSGQKGLAAALALAGLLYAPMAWLSVSLRHSFLAANPVAVLAAVGRVPVAYGIAALTVIGTFAATTTVESLLSQSAIGLPFAYMLGLYGTFVSMRILGLLYYHHADELDWFGESTRDYRSSYAR